MLDNFLKKSWNPILFRIIASAGFIIMMLALYFGTLTLIFNIKSSLVMFIFWILWWPFLYITLFFLGRFWCGFICPIGLLNEIGNSFGINKKNFLSKYVALPFILFFLIVFWEQVSGLFSSPSITLLFLSTFLISAFLIGVILPRWGFCKYFCPIGTLLGPFSRLSILSVRTNQNICETCETRECIRGGKVEPCPMFNNVPKLDSNKDCLLCLNCIKNCPHNSAKLSFISPGKELTKKAGFNLSESLFIVALLGLTIILTSRGTQFFRIFNIENIWVRAIDFILAISLVLIIYFILSYLSSKLNKNSFKENLILGGYILLPLVFAIMFFLIVFGFLTPLTKINANYIALSKYILIIIGSIWSLNLSIKLIKKPVFQILSILIIASLWFFILIPGPLNLFPIIQETYIVQGNETVQIDAFSMGFNPTIIKAKQGQQFYLDITNLDITHSFDLDNLNIHLNLQSGEKRIIKINPTESGEYEYYCNIPGHREAGMKGTLIIE